MSTKQKITGIIALAAVGTGLAMDDLALFRAKPAPSTANAITQQLTINPGSTTVVTVDGIQLFLAQSKNGIPTVLGVTGSRNKITNTKTVLSAASKHFASIGVRSFIVIEDVSGNFKKDYVSAPAVAIDPTITALLNRKKLTVLDQATGLPTGQNYIVIDDIAGGRTSGFIIIDDVNGTRTDQKFIVIDDVSGTRSDQTPEQSIVIDDVAGGRQSGFIVIDDVNGNYKGKKIIIDDISGTRSLEQPIVIDDISGGRSSETTKQSIVIDDITGNRQSGFIVIDDINGGYTAPVATSIATWLRSNAQPFIVIEDHIMLRGYKTTLDGITGAYIVIDDISGN